jgi:gluconokinase
MKIPSLRSDDIKVSGLVYFGRMLDKLRLREAGQLPPDYFTGTVNRTHFDARCCRFLRVGYDVLRKRVAEEGGTDEEILEWCYTHAYRPTDDEVEVWNEFMSKRGWRDSGSDELARAKSTRGYGHREDIQTWFDLHLAEES